MTENNAEKFSFLSAFLYLFQYFLSTLLLGWDHIELLTISVFIPVILPVWTVSVFFYHLFLLALEENSLKLWQILIMFELCLLHIQASLIPQLLSDIFYYVLDAYKVRLCHHCFPYKSVDAVILYLEGLTIMYWHQWKSWQNGSGSSLGRGHYLQLENPCQYWFLFYSSQT